MSMLRALLGVAILSAHVAVAGPLEDGLDAYRRGDYAAAARQFSDAAARGDTDAMLNLSMMYESLCGITPDGWEGEGWFDRAFDAGNAVAKFIRTQEILWNGGGKPPESATELADINRRAANGGYPTAMLMVALQYAQPPVDRVQADSWLALAMRRLGTTKDRSVESSMSQQRAQLEATLSPQQLKQATELTDKLDREIPRAKIIGVEECSPSDAIRIQSQFKPASARVSVPSNRIEYTVIDGGTLGGSYSWSYAIGEDGRIGGASWLPGTRGGATHAFARSPGGAIQDLSAGERDANSISHGYAINKDGIVAGDSGAAEGSLRAVVFVPKVGTRDLGTPEGHHSIATGINSLGAVVGTFALENQTISHAFIYSAQRGTEELTSFGWHSAEALAINDAGQVTGTANGRVFVYTRGSGAKRVSPPGVSGTGRAINALGHVVGDYLFFGNGAGGSQHAFVYVPDEGMRDLGLLPSAFGAIAYGINRGGQIVGTATGRAFIYTEEAGMRDLNDLIPPNSDWKLIEARGVNDGGQITGWGTLRGDTRAFVLTPVVH